MLNLENTQNRVRQILADVEGNRFEDSLLMHAIRQAMQTIGEKIPRVNTLEQTILATGRNQVVIGIDQPLFVMQVNLLPKAATRSLEFAYSLQSNEISLHFSGITYPESGQTLQITYAARHTLAGLDGSALTTLPDQLTSALDFGSSGYACLLRAAAISEAYGARRGESARLADQGRSWLEIFTQTLNESHLYQHVGYPAGFTLDRWDQQGETP